MVCPRHCCHMTANVIRSTLNPLSQFARGSYKHCFCTNQFIFSYYHRRWRVRPATQVKKSRSFINQCSVFPAYGRMYFDERFSRRIAPISREISNSSFFRSEMSIICNVYYTLFCVFMFFLLVLSRLLFFQSKASFVNSGKNGCNDF